MKRAEYIRINHSKQNILTITENTNNPLLLIIHGGPGSPDRPLVEKYNNMLTEKFTVVCWDQRGSGLSYCKDNLTVDMMVKDMKSVVEYLLEKYKQDKIYISGHSWGAYLGLRYVSLYPELVEYYIGTGQGISSCDEIYKYQFALLRATELGDEKTKNVLLKIGQPIGTEYKSNNVDSKKYVSSAVHKFGGYIHPSNDFNMNKYLSIYIKHYGFNILKVIKGIKHSLNCLEQEMLDDENTDIYKLYVPIKIISGEWDYICPKEEVKKWFDRLKAPVKDFVVIENAAHMVNFEQPEQWCKEILKLV